MRPFTPAPVITAPSPPVRTLRHRNLLWAYRARVFAVHIGDHSSNQATTLESQMIHMIQELFGQTLTFAKDKPYLMDWIQHDHRYLALGLKLIVGIGRPKFERLFPESEAFLARGCPGPRVHFLGPDLYFDVGVRQNIAIPPWVLGRASL